MSSNDISVINSMALAQGMNPKEYELTVRDTCGCKNATLEQFHAFLLVAREYGLNPLVKEIFAFPAKTGGITPIVSIDGWLRMANDHDAFDGLTFEDRLDANGNLLAITARLHRKDRGHPSEVTEYMAECRRNTDPWKTWPARMLRHKAAIQAIRYGLGFSGISDPDEGERMLPAPAPAKEPIVVRPKFDERPDDAADRVAAIRATIGAAVSRDDLKKIGARVIKTRWLTESELCDIDECVKERRAELDGELVDTTEEAESHEVQA
jgi:phage recombination protein Bet